MSAATKTLRGGLGLLPCGKVRHATRADAEQARELAQAADRAHGRRPAKMNIYPCLACGGAYHIGREHRRWK
jgi:hypothetical protein